MLSSHLISGAPIYMWVTAWALSLLSLAICIFALTSKRRIHPFVWRAIWCAGAAFPLAMLTADVAEHAKPTQVPAPLATAIFLSVLLGVAVNFYRFVWPRIVHLPQRKPRQFTLFASAILMVIVTMTGMEVMTESAPRANNINNRVPVHYIRKSIDVVALTDKNRPVTLLSYPEGGVPDPWSVPESLNGSLIKCGPIDVSANCHGWVFTKGQHLICGYDVEVILLDNGYVPISEPQENDIIIYRNASGYIVHTGLVRVVDDDGLVLIESKWGVYARYLHRPEDQVFSDSYQYYRSPRQGHFLQFVEANGIGVPPEAQDGMQRSKEVNRNQLPGFKS